MEIRKSVSQHVGYSGKVEIELQKNGLTLRKIAYNSGTKGLFTYICKCLAGELNPMIASADIDERPGGLWLYSDKTDDDSRISYGVVASTCVIGETDTASYITYEFLVPGVALVGKTVRRVRLVPLSGTQDIYYAEAEIENDDGITIADSNINLYLRWTLTIENI